MKISEKEFIDEFMDRLYLCGNKTDDGKYTLTLSEAEFAAEQLYRIVYEQEDKTDQAFAKAMDENNAMVLEIDNLNIALSILKKENNDLKSQWVHHSQNSARDPHERNFD